MNFSLRKLNTAIEVESHPFIRILAFFSILFPGAKLQLYMHPETAGRQSKLHVARGVGASAGREEAAGRRGGRTYYCTRTLSTRRIACAPVHALDQGRLACWAGVGIPIDSSCSCTPPPPGTPFVFSTSHAAVFIYKSGQICSQTYS